MIYKIMRAADMDGKSNLKTVCFIGAKNKKAAKKKVAEYGIHIGKTSFEKIEALDKKEAAKIKKKIIQEYDISVKIYAIVLASLSSDDITKTEKKMIKRLKASFQKNETLYQQITY